MSFASGPISFRRFAVVGKFPTTIDQSILDRIAEFAIQPTETGVPDELEYGFSGGRHVLDASFSFNHNVFADCLFFGLRIDTNRVPSDLKKAYQIMEEEAVAATNPSGFISKLQKRDVKDSVRRKVDDDLRSGKFRRSKLIPLLWDLPSQTLYASVTGKAFQMLSEIFDRVFNVNLLPLSAGSIALRLLEPHGRRRDYEDLRPTRFAPGPEGEGQYPDYPWVMKGPEPKDFIGNEFLLWLWHEADHRTGAVQTDRKGIGEVTIFIDRFLDLDCSYGQTGRDSLRGDGPSRMPEARDALRSGKVPRKAGLLLNVNRQDFRLTFNPEGFAVTSAIFPDIEEADTPRVLFEERIALLRDFSKTLDTLFETFLKLRGSSAWESQSHTIRRWITQTQKAVAAA